MNSPTIKRNTVSGRHIPTQDLIIVAMPLNVGKGLVIFAVEFPALIA